MGFSGFKIPGHTGTAFKNRKAFGFIRAYDSNGSSNNEENSSDLKNRPKLAPKNYQKANRTSWLHKVIGLPLLLIFIVMILYLISAYLSVGIFLEN